MSNPVVIVDFPVECARDANGNYYDDTERLKKLEEYIAGTIGSFYSGTGGSRKVLNREFRHEALNALNMDSWTFVEKRDKETVAGKAQWNLEPWTASSNNACWRTGEFGFKLNDSDAKYKSWSWFEVLENWMYLDLKDVKVTLRMRYGSELNPDNPNDGVDIPMKVMYNVDIFHGGTYHMNSDWAESGQRIYICPDADGLYSGVYSQIGHRDANKNYGCKGEDIQVVILPQFVSDQPADVPVSEYIASGSSGEPLDVVHNVATVTTPTAIQGMYPTKGEMVDNWKLRIRSYEGDYGINFERELYTVSDSGRIVGWINEQCQLLGAPFSIDHLQYTQQTYDGMLQLKKYFKEINEDLYDALEIELACNENSSLTGRAECDGVGPCGCYSIGCAIFQEYTDNLSEPEPTDEWNKVLMLSSTAKEAHSALKDVTISSNLASRAASSNNLKIEIGDTMKFRVKDGWELLLRATMLDSSGNEINENTAPHYDGMVWENIGTRVDYRLKGGDVFGIGSGMNYLVGNDSAPNKLFELHFKPHRKRTKPNPFRVEQRLQNMGYNPNQVNNCEINLEIVSVRSPYNEWLGGGVSVPGDFGIITGLDAAARAAKVLQSKFESDFNIFAEIRIGYELEIVLIFDVTAGLIFRCEAHKDRLEVQMGAYFSAGAEIPGVATTEAGAETITGYKLRYANFPNDSWLMIKDIFNTFLPDGMEFRTYGIQDISLPYTKTVKFGGTLLSYSTQNIIEYKSASLSGPTYQKKKKWLTVLNNGWPFNAVELSHTSNIGDPITGESFDEIEIFLGLIRDSSISFLNGTDVSGLGLSLLNSGLGVVLIPAAGTALSELSENWLGTTTPFAGIPLALVMASDVKKTQVVLGDIKKMFSAITSLRSPLKILPSLKNNSWDKSFDTKLVVGVKAKVRLPTSNFADPLATMINNAGNPVSLRSEFETLQNTNNATNFDMGLHFAFTGKWTYEQWPKIPIAGPFILGGLKISIEAGLEFDGWISDLGLIDQTTSNADLRQHIVDEWLNPNPNPGGGN